MVRIIDVAKKANVSTATVSRVLSKPNTVTEETTEKVLQVIKELNYQPNALARQLRTLETKTILVIVPDITNPFFSKVLRGIESVAVINGYQVLLGDTGNDLERENGYLNILLQKKADGMVLLTARMESKNIEEMALKYPVVLACEYIEGSAIPTVSINNISGAQKATEYLVKLGHKRIGFISGPLDGVIGQDRLKGFYQTMTRHNLTVESILVQEGNFSYESGFNIMNQFLALNHPPTAVFAANDEMAFGAINAISSKGLSVPHDISVVGFDDIKFSSIFKPTLTTISQPAFEMGTMAMKLLIKLMNKEEIERPQYLMEDQLIIRNSCSTHIS
ncbi:LacI family DNA-binding transcriptional regulator [Priestia megaterium]|uniref:LacI family DNA-binding transcriptional regulator n=1 Tax=Priestia megaterium TaxID=1404 RepID=UPI001C303A9B|nr:LacI family DNA-binding transcriptional regulator [Priestia megaterium]MCP1451180.1 LacI family repressor for deo operon, udp, cdd, tsx, nupC, and nupG [Priestia megaterium]MED4048032.1 LacI family DNA-binding transcriptional regulator [Priestia megaterium]WJD82659.1 LacI family DNA-binding transcriptional regulator [Priestia megaterium]